LKIKAYILPVIVIAQFFCTSLWFAGNSIINDLISHFNLPQDALAHLTSAVQLGFVMGTLIFALFTISDRFSPSKVFFVCALLGSLFNLGAILPFNNLTTLLLFRFLTGFLLAGIYPVGMKIAADYYDKGLGKSLGFLLGALVMGIAFPHFIKGFTNGLDWKLVSFVTSGIAAIGGLFVFLFIPNGPFRTPGQKIHLRSFFKIFDNSKFRAAAFGYFGHMWELYTFWAFVPSILIIYVQNHPIYNLNISIISFIIIACGAVACMLIGILSLKISTKKLAIFTLSASCICCLISPFFLTQSSLIFFLIFLSFWAMMVIADSPMFATLVAQNAPVAQKGTALTIVNSIGFAITILSIQFINWIKDLINPQLIYVFLAIGPILGLVALVRNSDNKAFLKEVK
jgi:MFS family permease